MGLAPRAEAEQSIERLVAALKRLVERRLLPAGVQPDLLDLGRLSGQVWVRSSLKLPALSKTLKVESPASLPVAADDRCYILYARAHVQTAPSGANLLITLKRDGQAAASAQLVVAADETVGYLSGAAFPQRFTARDEVWTFDVTQVGSTTAGAGLVVSLVWLAPAYLGDALMT